MKNRIAKTLLGSIVAITISPAIAQADDDKGLYGSLNFGAANVSDVEIQIYDADGEFDTADGVQDTIDTAYDLKSASSLGGSLGYDFGAIRGELEVNYARNKVRGISISKVNGTAVTLTAGDEVDFCDYAEIDNCTLSGNTVGFANGPRLRQLNAMANIWYDIPVGGKIEPYIGGGLGIAGFEVDGEGKSHFAWQLGAGVAYNISPSFALTADIRHSEAGKTSIAYDANSGFRVGKIKTTSYGLGLRVRF
jgi:opacity protein-like surface antigen